jgi:hypothetical protein
MNHPNNLPGTERPSPLTEGSSEQFFFYICCGNASIIRAYKDLLEYGARTHNGACGYYFASDGTLWAREQEARKASLPFVGESYMGSKCEPMSHIHEVLVELKISAQRTGIHVAFISVDQSGVSYVHEAYRKLLNQAIPQGILPFSMYVTNDEGSAESLLDSFESRSW